MRQPRVTYWTGTWDPAREAHSKEIEALRRVSGRRSPVVSISAGQDTALLPRDGVVRLAGRHWPLFRVLAALVERRGDLSHVFGEMNAWHLLRGLGRRPLLFTVTIPGPALEPALYDKVALFAAESEALASDLAAAGVAEERVRVVHPGIDLSRFPVQPLPAPEPFRLLFASSPAHAGELEERGIPILVELARRLPGIEILCFWRTWDDASASRSALEVLHPPPNFKVIRRDLADMTEAFRQAHATIALFAAGFGKSCPNSILEGLACGRPAVLSDTCGIAAFLARSGAGAVGARDPGALAAAVERVRDDFDTFRERARDLAEERFSHEAFRGAYREIYAELTA